MISIIVDKEKIILGNFLNGAGIVFDLSSFQSFGCNIC